MAPGVYGSTGSTVRWPGAANRYDIVWVKTNGNRSQSTTGWSRVMPLNTTHVVDFGNIAAGGQAEIDVILVGMVAGDLAFVVPASAPQPGLVFTARAKDNLVTIIATNPTGSAINPASNSYRVGGIRR